MLTSELDYELPERLIARRPSGERSGARMMIIGEASSEDSLVESWPELVTPGSLVVLNDTRVMRARVFAERSTGGRVELLFLGPRDGGAAQGPWFVVARASKRIPVGTELATSSARLQVLENHGDGRLLVNCDAPVAELLEREGRVPLPPYLRRPDDEDDVERYQTVFATHLGSSAAPTAGLHLTHEMLQRLQGRGVEVAKLTLHVGLGTFRPVTTPTLEEHRMHREWLRVDEHLCQRVNRARSEGRSVVAVGTTVVRALESSFDGERLQPHVGETDLLISPGYRFGIVDALLTNFHAPQSTLLALMYAFAGTDRMRAAYREAVAREYRFLSYGDAMWLPKQIG